jgi:hypothetical protein
MHNSADILRSTPTAVYGSISTRKNKKGMTLVLHLAVPLDEDGKEGYACA